MTRTLDLAIIGGDGIGPEVTAEALKANPKKQLRVKITSVFYEC